MQENTRTYNIQRCASNIELMRYTNEVQYTHSYHDREKKMKLVVLVYKGMVGMEAAKYIDKDIRPK